MVEQQHHQFFQILSVWNQFYQIWLLQSKTIWMDWPTVDKRRGTLLRYFGSVFGTKVGEGSAAETDPCRWFGFTTNTKMMTSLRCINSLGCGLIWCAFDFIFLLVTPATQPTTALECAAASTRYNLQSVTIIINPPNNPLHKLLVDSCPTWSGGCFSYWLPCCHMTHKHTHTDKDTAVGTCTKAHTGEGERHMIKTQVMTQCGATARWRQDDSRAGEEG